MIRLGMVDCDTSHAVAFSQRFNHAGIAEDQWVQGATVVAAFPGTSRILPQERVDTFANGAAAAGVRIVQSPEEMIGQIDAVLIESQDGSVHAERAMPFINAGIPTFVDKPFVCSVTDARRILDAAEARGVPLFSASSVRYAPDVQQLKQQIDSLGGIFGCDTAGPAALHPRNPGFFHYGVHAVEVLYELMGTGCQRVRCISNEKTDLAVGIWDDGRIGTVRGIRGATYAFTFTAVCGKEVRTRTIDGTYMYRELLAQIVTTLTTGVMPLSREQLIEPIAFQEAALRSAQHDGREMPLAR